MHLADGLAVSLCFGVGNNFINVFYVVFYYIINIKRINYFTHIRKISAVVTMVMVKMSFGSFLLAVNNNVKVSAAYAALCFFAERNFGIMKPDTV